ncbi:MAG TPA: choice-of-anchor D domain-containing protein [Kofleriaceae bacterium]|nr:choice-of-anchor D domain-containing protein [Kofleriaceae bacterium]
MLVRGIAVALVSGAALVAYAVGNGDIRANPEVTVITITSATGTGTGTASLQNTTGATTYSVLVGSDASCDPSLMFSVVGGNPVVISPTTMRNVNLTCPARGTPAMRRCLYHATNNTNGTALADFMTVCLYGNAPGTLAPQQTTIDFGTVTVGDNAMQQIDVRNNGTLGQFITRVYLQTDDLGGNFQFSNPCNPDAPFCDEDVMAIGQGGTLPIQVKCTPQTPGLHTAQLYIGTNTFQLLAQPVTLTCNGAATTVPVLGLNPTNISLPTPVDAASGSASTVVHLTNAGAGSLVIHDVRTVDVDAGAANDWTYAASGECSGQITMSCSLEPGEQVDINLTFDPSGIGRRRATLLVSYKDSIDRTKEIPLDGRSIGGTLDVAGDVSTLVFGSVPVGRSSAIDFALTNHGNLDLDVNLALAASSTPPFTLSPAASTVVMANVDRAVTLTCAPTTASQFMTSVTATAMDAVNGSPTTLNATCEGSTLDLFANPTALNLGEVRAGGGEVRRTIQLLNTNAPSQLTLNSQMQVEGNAPGLTLGALSQLTTPATFDVVLDPPADADEGQMTGAIIVTDTAGEMLRIPLSGKVVRAGYEAANALDLGTFCVGQPTTSSNVSLVSDGTATIALMQPTLGQVPSPFELETTSPSVYPTVIAAGAAATVSITPHRQTAVVQLDDTLAWHTDVAGMETATTAITARFIDQGGAIAPPALDFGKALVHLYSEDGQRVMIQNCNPTPLQLDEPMIKTPFKLESPLPSVLNPNETAAFSVGFHPTQIGVVETVLRITSPQLPGAPLEVMLRGEGTSQDIMEPDAGMGSNGTDDTSFYACSCKSTRPGGILPIVLALMCVLFPRRSPSFSRRRRPRVRIP